MTREEAKSFAPIIQAYSDGNVIQMENAVGEWKDVDWDLCFHGSPTTYRIKPKIREFWIAIPKDRPPVVFFRPHRDANDGGMYEEIIHVKEVMP